MASDLIVVKSKIKEMVGEYNVSSDFVAALDAKTKQLLNDALERMKANGRRTVMGKDV
ncbi:DUF1931 domain-containing protein [Candidatus Woesearchaeota archaeon]|nr:MAG: DUF1931 domain-containing protein [Candidatus Woesearchaeota archaeon]